MSKIYVGESGIGPLRPLARRTASTTSPALAFAALADVVRSIRQVHGISAVRPLWRTIRYAARCFVHFGASARWLGALKRSPLRAHVARQPRLLLKPQRAYVSRCYEFSDRATALLNHYWLAASSFSTATAAELLAGRRLALASIAGKDERADFRLFLAKTDKFDREGELVLTLQTQDEQETVQLLVFSFAMREAQRCVVIGCLQGGNSARAQTLVKETTKALHGIRPKNFLLGAIYALTRSCGMQRIYGISNAARVFRGDRVHADYDAFWLEQGAVPDRDGFFALPAELPTKVDVPSHRRAEYRRRSELRADTAAQIRASLAGNAASFGRTSAVVSDVGSESIVIA